MGITLEEGKVQIHATACAISGIYSIVGLHMSLDNIQTIKEAPQSKNQQQLRAFLGLVNYHKLWLLGACAYNFRRNIF